MKILEKNLPLFPLQTVVFPQSRLPLSIFEPRYVEMIERCLNEDLAFGVVLIKEGSEVGEPAVPYQIGTIVRIVDVARLDDGRMNLIAAGITRFKISEFFADLPYMTANVQVWRDEDVDIAKAEVVRRQASKSFERYVRAVQNIAATEEQELEDKPLEFPKDPTLLSYLIAANLQVSNLDKQSLLEAPTTIARLRREMLFMERERELLRLVSEKTDRVIDQGTFSLN
jgi:hypothetical protein